MKKLNTSQQKILAYLQERIPTGLPPTVREICTATGIKSTSTVHLYLKVLEEEGYITRDSRLNRAIHFPGESIARVPLLGRVTAGLPILAREEVDCYVPYSGDRYDPKDLFALRICGTSMLGAGILDRDVVIVRRTPTADNGDIVVALLGDEATVKRFYKENGRFRLQPENDAYEPIIVDEVTILGKVIALIRHF